MYCVFLFLFEKSSKSEYDSKSKMKIKKKRITEGEMMGAVPEVEGKRNFV